MSAPMVITGYSIEGTGTIHFFTADQRRSAYEAARDMAAMRGKTVAVKVIRKEKPKPDVQAALNALGPLEPPLEGQRGMGVMNASGIYFHFGDMVQPRHGTAKGTVTGFLSASHSPALVGEKVVFVLVHLTGSSREEEYPIDNLVVIKWAESLEEEKTPVSGTYEVFVPVKVTVKVGKYNMTTERPVVSTEWSGFHGEAEDSEGVWSVDDEDWGAFTRDAEATIAAVARQSVQNHLDVAYDPRGPMNEAP